MTHDGSTNKSNPEIQQNQSDLWSVWDPPVQTNPLSCWSSHEKNLEYHQNIPVCLWTKWGQPPLILKKFKYSTCQGARIAYDRSYMHCHQCIFKCKLLEHWRRGAPHHGPDPSPNRELSSCWPYFRAPRACLDFLWYSYHFLASVYFVMPTISVTIVHPA